MTHGEEFATLLGDGAQELGDWYESELDPDGVPYRLPVALWAPAAQSAAEFVKRHETDWGSALETKLAGLSRAAVRFARPDGSPVFAPSGRGGPLRDAARYWSARSGSSDVGEVVARWFPRGGPGPGNASPFLPADARRDRPLAMLRADWLAKGDFVAADHRALGGESLIEVTALGRRLLGPSWTSADLSDPTRAVPTAWTTSPTADALEWSFRAGDGARVVRTAALFRGRRLALLAEETTLPIRGTADRPAPPRSWRVDLGPGISALPIAGSSAWLLAAKAGAPSAHVVPLGLPCPAGEEADMGFLAATGGGLTIAGPAGVRRAWLPLLVSWDPARRRRVPTWCPLTVAERSSPCPADVAFAARVNWGEECYVVYRSLAEPALRSFLGHQTSARFLFGRFNPLGDIEPLLKFEK